MEKENEIKEIPETIDLNRTSVLKDNENNKTSLGSPERMSFGTKEKTETMKRKTLKLKS